MHTDPTRTSPQCSDRERFGPSNVATVGSRGTSGPTVAALSLRERLLLSVGIQAACVAIRAAELLAGEGWRAGRGRPVRSETRTLTR